jgi:methylase of polypeptide subunit release factors
MERPKTRRRLASLEPDRCLRRCERAEKAFATRYAEQRFVKVAHGRRLDALLEVALGVGTIAILCSSDAIHALVLAVDARASAYALCAMRSRRRLRSEGSRVT